MTGVIRTQGLQEDLISECYSCGAKVALQRNSLTGEIYDCPDCGIELELALYQEEMKEQYGPIHRVNYDGVITSLTLAQAPEEGEDWGE